MPDPRFKRRSPSICANRLSAWLLGLALVMIVTSGATADERLSGLLENALQRSFQLKIEQSRIAAARADLETTRASLLPQLALDGVAGFNSSGVMGHRVAGQDTQNGTYAEIRLSMQHLLLDGGARQHRIDQAVSTGMAAKERYRFAESEVLREALTALVHYHHAERVMAHSKAALAFAQEQVALEVRRHREGIATITELEQARAHVELVRASFNSAKAAGNKARSHVGGAIGLPDLAGLVPRTVEAATMLALENHPLIAASGHQVGAAVSRVEQERAEMLPALFLEGHVAKGTDPVTLATDSRAIGLRVSIPLTAPATARARLTRRHEARVQVELDRDSILRDVVSQLEELYEAMRLSRENLKTSGRAAELMARVLGHAVEERDFDLRTTPELLRVHSKVSDVTLGHLQARLALEVSQVEILAAIGNLPALLQKTDGTHQKQQVSASPMIAKTDAWAALRISSRPPAKLSRKSGPPPYDHTR